MVAYKSDSEHDCQSLGSQQTWTLALHSLCFFAKAKTSFDSPKLPHVMIIDLTPAARERSSIASKSSDSTVERSVIERRQSLTTVTRHLRVSSFHDVRRGIHGLRDSLLQPSFSCDVRAVCEYCRTSGPPMSIQYMRVSLVVALDVIDCYAIPMNL